MSRREQIPPFLSPGVKWWEAVEECARLECGTAGAPATCAAERRSALRCSGRAWGVPRCPRRVSSWGSSGHFLSILTLTKLGPLPLSSSRSVAIVSKIRLSAFLPPPPPNCPPLAPRHLGCQVTHFDSQGIRQRLRTLRTRCRCLMRKKLTGVEEGKLWWLRKVPQDSGRCPNPSQAGLASVWGEIPAQLG